MEKIYKLSELKLGKEQKAKVEQKKWREKNRDDGKTFFHRKVNPVVYNALSQYCYKNNVRASKTCVDFICNFILDLRLDISKEVENILKYYKSLESIKHADCIAVGFWLKKDSYACVGEAAKKLSLATDGELSKKDILCMAIIYNLKLHKGNQR